MGCAGVGAGSFCVPHWFPLSGTHTNRRVKAEDPTSVGEPLLLFCVLFFNNKKNNKAVKRAFASHSFPMSSVGLFYVPDLGNQQLS